MPAEISCDPAALAKASACFNYSDGKVADAVIIYLLAQLAGNTMTPAQLAKAAACYVGQDAKMMDAEKVYLLCQAATAAGA